VALQDPKLIHAEQRLKAKKFSIYGVEIGSVQKMQENGASSPTIAPRSRSTR
jgi:hypothetical protein